MIPTLSRPAPAQLAAAVRAEAAAPLTYTEVGQTWGDTPAGFAFDEQQVLIGAGRGDFTRATHLLRAWTQFDLPWLLPLDRTVPLVEGAMFAFASYQCGVWASNVCRVVKVVDEQDDDGARLGFSYGTVGTHALRGEERFLLRWHAASDEVSFGIRKFSTPAGPLFTLLDPLTRAVQRRFTREALARMAEAMRA